MRNLELSAYGVEEMTQVETKKTEGGIITGNVVLDALAWHYLINNYEDCFWFSWGAINGAAARLGS